MIDSILIIDDDEMTRGTLCDIFEAEKTGHIQAVATSEEALETLKKESFQIIVADYNLPGSSGVELIEKLRLSGNRTPILLLSGVLDKNAVLRGIHYPKTEFLTKPFNIIELVEKVHKLMAL